MTIYYTTASKVYSATGISSAVISEADVNIMIEDACDEVDHICNTTFWVLVDSGTADAGGGDDELDDAAKTFVADAYIDYYCWIYGGTGIGQIRKITDNTVTKITLDRDWETNPDATSTYRVLATNPSTDPYSSVSVDGTGTEVFFLDQVPLLLLETLTVDSTSVTTSSVYQYKNYGKLELGTDAEVSFFSATTPQLVDLAYWYGMYPIPRIVERYTTLLAGMRALTAQIGGTFDDVTSFSVPHMTGSLGEPYTNIREALTRLEKERDRLRPMLPIYQAIVEN